MTESQWWVIVDNNDQLIGSWYGSSYWFDCYDTKKDPIKAAKELGLPKFTIISALNAINYKPHSSSK